MPTAFATTGYIARQGGNPRNLSLYGQEKNLGTWAICKMNMLLHGFLDEVIEKGDTIRDPKLLVGGELMLFDVVIANPPFSLDNWGREVAENDPFGRFRFGIPPKGKGDLAFVQHMISILNSHGRMAVVMPHGVLFRGGAEEEIRKGIVEEDLLEAVIGLAPNLFYGTGIPAAILALSRKKTPERRGRVLLVDGSREFKEGLNQNTLAPENIQKFLEVFQQFAEVPRFSRPVPVSEIRSNDYNLNLTRYLDVAEQEEATDLRSALERLRAAEMERDRARAAMARLLAELGIEQ